MVATEAAGPKLSLAEQARRLLADIDDAVAVFAPDGALLHATEAAREMLGRNGSLAALGAMPLAATALMASKAAGGIEGGSLSLKRLGMDTSTALLARLTRSQEQAAPAPIEAIEPPAAELVIVIVMRAGPRPRRVTRYLPPPSSFAPRTATVDPGGDGCTTQMSPDAPVTM